nr:hypothetical protein [Tanacetum cinerariifolium]
KEKGVIDSGCSRHITGNKCYFTEYEDYDGGFVSFRDGKGRISRTGKIKTGTLDFNDVYFCNPILLVFCFVLKEDKQKKLRKDEQKMCVLFQLLKKAIKMPDFKPGGTNSITQVINYFPGFCSYYNPATKQFSHKIPNPDDILNVVKIDSKVNSINILSILEDNYPRMVSYQWKSRIKKYIDTKPNHELIHYCLKNPPYKFTWADKEVLIFEGSSVITTERYMETYKNVSQDIRDQLNAEAKAVQIILTRIDNDIYSTVDACLNACEMWKAIERLKQDESINVQDLETNLYWEFGKFTSQDGESLESYYSRFYKMMNELIKNQCDVTNHQVNVQFLLQLQPEWQRSQQSAIENRGKAIVNSPPPIYDQEPSMVAEDDEMSKDKEIDKLMALISLSVKKIYKPTNNNLRTSSNTSRANQDNSPRINRSTRYENQRIGNVAGARETVGQRMQLLCKQEEAEIQLNAEQADWRDDTNDESEDQELEAHFMYMAQIQEVSPDAADSGPIFDTDPLQKVSNDDHYNVFAIKSEHPEKSKSAHETYPIEQDKHNVIIDSLDTSYDREQIDQNDDDNDLVNERELLASLIEKLKCEIDDSKHRNKFLESSNKVLVEKSKGEIEDLKKTRV